MESSSRAVSERGWQQRQARRLDGRRVRWPDPGGGLAAGGLAGAGLVGCQRAPPGQAALYGAQLVSSDGQNDLQQDALT